MTTNNIREDKSVNAENFEFLLAQSNYNLSTVFRSRNHNETIADTPITSADTSNDVSKTPEALEENTSRNHQYTFKILGASTNQIADLKDCEINVLASVVSSLSGTDLTLADVPRLGNQALLSLFSNIELFMDDKLIERIETPGMSACADYALRYPHSKQAEKLLESNGYITSLDDFFAVSTESSGGLYTSTVETDGIYKFKDESIMWQVVDPTSGNDWLRGVINQRIKLADIFPCVATLPPIFNHSITVNFTRNSQNNIIATPSKNGQHTRLNAFINFKITQDCYIITDELRKAAMQYYSKPIETIFTSCKQIAKNFVSEPQKNITMTFNISVDSAYKNKLAVFCIPRTSNFSNQIYSATAQKNNLLNYQDAKGKQFDVAQAPSNSYTHGGLTSMNIYTMNGVKLYGFDMARDGVTKGNINVFDKLSMMDIHTSATDALIYNYQDVYQQYLKAREQFGQIQEEGLDYVTFLKEYCIYCVDLSPFTIGAGENLRVEMSFGDWGDSYNPYHARNDKDAPYMSRTLLTLFYSDKILRLLPNQNVELADLFQARTESDETNIL